MLEDIMKSGRNLFAYISIPFCLASCGDTINNYYSENKPEAGYSEQLDGNEHNSVFQSDGGADIFHGSTDSGIHHTDQDASLIIDAGSQVSDAGYLAPSLDAGVCKESQRKETYSGTPQTAHMGNCRPKIEECINGSFIVIQDEVLPSTELCDGMDNDCNGIIDEGINEIVECNTWTPCKGHQEKECINGEWIYGECSDLLNISNNPKREWSPRVWDGKILFLRENVPLDETHGGIADLMLYNIETKDLQKLREIPLNWSLSYSGFDDYKNDMMVQQRGKVTDLNSGEVIVNIGENCQFNSELDLGKYVCYEGEPTCNQNSIVVYDSETNRREVIDSEKSCNEHPSFNGKYVAFGGNNGETPVPQEECSCSWGGNNGIPLEILVYNTDTNQLVTIPHPNNVTDTTPRVSNGKVLFNREFWGASDNHWMLYDTAISSLEDITPDRRNDCYIGAFTVFEGNVIVCLSEDLGYSALTFKNILSNNLPQKVSFPSTYHLFEMDLNGKYLVLGGNGFQSEGDRDIYVCELKDEFRE